MTRGTGDRGRRGRLLVEIDCVSPTIPVRKTMVETESHLGSLVHGHLMLVLATHLGECADALVDPFVAIDLLSTTLGR
jgi:hypothetical protein